MENKNKELLLKKIDELIEIIKNTDDYKRYEELKIKMENNNSIMSLIKKIKEKQKTIIRKESIKEKTTEEEKELNILKEELNSYPIYQEYTYLQEDLNNMFQNIREIIENSFTKNNS